MLAEIERFGGVIALEPVRVVVVQVVVVLRLEVLNQSAAEVVLVVCPLAVDLRLALTHCPAAQKLSASYLVRACE